MENICKFRLDSVGLEFVLKSNVFTTDQKITILNAVDVLIIDNNTDLAYLIFEILLNKKSCQKVNFLQVEKLVAQKIHIHKKVKLITKQAEHLTSLEIARLLTLSGPPLSGIPNNQKPSVENIEIYKELAEMLINKSILSSFKEDDKGMIRLHPKRT